MVKRYIIAEVDPEVIVEFDEKVDEATDRDVVFVYATDYDALQQRCENAEAQVNWLNQRPILSEFVGTVAQYRIARDKWLAAEPKMPNCRKSYP